jgi:hypothetical protein
VATTVTPPPAPSAPEPTAPADRPRSTTKRVIVAVAIALSVFVAALGVTGVTGLGGPGPIHRYTYAELGDLADLLNVEAGDLRTPDDCWRTLTGAEGPLRDIAKVDYLRSRVVLRLYSRQLGKLDASVRNQSERAIEELLVSHPEFTRDMIVTEPSPDGWSPKLTCRISSGSRIAGF